MAKNDAFKSFLKPLLFCLGTFVSFFLFVNNSFAWWGQSVADTQITHSSVTQGWQFIGSNNPQDITQIKLKYRLILGGSDTYPCTVHWHANTSLIYDIEAASYIGNYATTSDYVFDNATDTEEITFNASNLSLEYAKDYKITTLDALGTQIAEAHCSATGNPYTTPMGSSTNTWAIGIWEENTAQDQYFQFTDAYVASNPVATWSLPLSSSSVGSLIDFTGEAEISHGPASASYGGSITGSWGTSVASVSDNIFLYYTFNTATTSFDTAFAASSTGSIYVQLLVTDTYNSLTYSEIRALQNQELYVPSAVFSTLEERFNTQCDTYGVVVSDLCKFFAWLIIPSDTALSDLKDSINEFKTYPPFSYWYAFFDEINAYSENGESWTPIPAFINTWIAWFYWILFSLAILKFSTRIFKG